MVNFGPISTFPADPFGALLPNSIDEGERLSEDSGQEPAEDSSDPLFGMSAEKALPPPLPKRSETPPPPRRRLADELLADLPDSQPDARRAVTATDVTISEAQRIAESYENELREKFEERRAAPRSFWRRYWLALSVVGAAVLAAAVALGGYELSRRNYNHRHATEFLDRAQQGLTLDTFASLSGATHQMDELLAVDPGNQPAQAVWAQAQATLCRDYGCSRAQREQAQAYLQAAGQSDPQAVLVARRYLSTDPAALDKEILALPATITGTWIDLLTGQALIDRHDDAAALRHFDDGLKRAPTHVPTLVAAGNALLNLGDPQRAAELFEVAHQASPNHVGAAVGLAEAHLALHEPVEDDEKQLLAVVPEGSGAVPEDYRQRLDLILARVLAVDGKVPLAIRRLEDGLSGHGEELAAYAGALADVYAWDGQNDRAESEAWRALNRTPKDPTALERYGQALLARGRYREILSRVPAEGSRRLHVLRAEAALGIGDVAGARAGRGHPQGQQGAPLGAVILARCCRAREWSPGRSPARVEADRRSTAPSGGGRAGSGRNRATQRSGRGAGRRAPGRDPGRAQRRRALPGRPD